MTHPSDAGNVLVFDPEVAARAFRMIWSGTSELALTSVARDFGVAQEDSHDKYFACFGVAQGTRSYLRTGWPSDEELLSEWEGVGAEGDSRVGRLWNGVAPAEERR